MPPDTREPTPAERRKLLADEANNSLSSAYSYLRMCLGDTYAVGLLAEAREVMGRLRSLLSADVEDERKAG
ncbi:MAG: hypothetical protein IT477_10895 [Rhodanobacteraceae bacterium]|nr:hypothetical protein [Rhodanobacteraceae bacterium]